jgi:hypothetical protein
VETYARLCASIAEAQERDRLRGYLHEQLSALDVDTEAEVAQRALTAALTDRLSKRKGAGKCDGFFLGCAGAAVGSSRR